MPNWTGAYLYTVFTGTTVDGGDVFYQGVRGTVNLTSTPLSSGTHTLQVEYRSGDCLFKGLAFDSGAGTVDPNLTPKLVEFVGDSITVGQTNDRQALDAYGWVVSERLGLEHTQIAQGGACLVETSDGCVGLSERFFNTSSLPSSAAWDVSRYTAEAVVINLGTNDVGHSVSTTTFQSTYTTFLAMANLKQRYATQPQAAVAARNASQRGWACHDRRPA